MKKFIAYILTLALLFVPLSACGEQESIPASGGQEPISSDNAVDQPLSEEEMDTITHNLLADWYAYAAWCEYLYGDMLWALSYLDPFFDSHSWDDLQTARAALQVAQRWVEQIDPPQATQMSLDDYDKLIQSGADVGYVQIAVSGISSLKSSMLLEYRIYQTYLNSPIEEFFLTYQLAHLENWASIMRQLYEIYLCNCAVETDYVLLAVDNEVEESRFLDAIAEKCPELNARRAGNPQDKDALLQKMNDLADEIERLDNEMSANVGLSQAGLDLFRDALESDPFSDMNTLDQYIASMTADAVELTDFPTALPYPNWWYEQEDQDFIYIWKDVESGEKSSGMTGDTIKVPPDQYYIEWPGIPLEKYQSYLETLEGYGISAEFITEKDGTYTAFYELQTGSFALIWEENDVSFLTMDGSVCFAPPWYVIHAHQTAS